MTFQIVQDFGNTAITRETGIFGTCATRENAPFKHDNFTFWMFSAKVYGTGQTHDTTTNNGEVYICKPGFIFPIAKVHLDEANRQIYLRYLQKHFWGNGIGVKKKHLIPRLDFWN